MSPFSVLAADSHADWWAELRAIIGLSWPMALTNLAQLAMATTDIIMMGRLSAETLAAGALGVNLYLVALIFGIGLLNATAPLVAADVGANRATSEVRRTVQQALWSAVCISIPAWLVLWWTGPILHALGQDPALSPLAATYVHALQWALVPFLGYLALRGFVSALERPAVALAIGLAGVAVNALGNWCLMLGHCGIEPMGIAGSGLATTLTSCALFAALAVVAIRDPQFAGYALFERCWRPDWERFRAFWRLGLPLAATLSFEVTIFNAAVFLMGLIGPASLAAHAIAIQIAALSFMVPLGVGQAATVRVGLAYGAGDRQGISRAGWTAYALTLALMVTLSLIMIIMPKTLIGLFLNTADPANAEIIRLATSFLLLAALFQIVDGGQAVGAGMLRGLQDGRVPMLYALLGYWVIGLPVGAALAFWAKLGGVGIWIGLASGLTIVAALMLLRWSRRERLGLVKHVVATATRKQQ